MVDHTTVGRVIKDMNYREAIDQFWDYYGGKKCCGKGHDPDQKLQRLIRLSHYRIGKRRKNERGKFEKIKWKRHSLRSHPFCFICRCPAEVRHHIIQIQNGGINAKRNIVSLCRACHIKIHPWIKDW